MKQINWLLLALFLATCTSLEEQVLDEALNADLLNEADAAEHLLAPVYAKLSSNFNSHRDVFLFQEISTDKAILPIRGGRDFNNGGQWAEAHLFTWTADHRRLDDIWGNFTTGISRSLLARFHLADSDSPWATRYKAEARAMAAFYNYYLLDMWGLVLKKEPEQMDFDDRSEVLKGQAAIDYLVAELETTLPDLPTRDEVDAGRFSNAAAQMLLARLYLNKAVYLDRYAASFSFANADLDEVIRHCDQLINSGHFDLEREDYFRIFDIDNHNHPEHIFVINHIDNENGANGISWVSLSRAAHGSLIHLEGRGADGVAITPEFYATWEDNQDDPRFQKISIPQDSSLVSIPESDWTLNRGLMVGPQFGIVMNEAQDDFKRSSNGDLLIEPLFNFERDNSRVIHTVTVDFESNNGHNTGVRVHKYQFDPIAPDGRFFSRVDLPLMRLADVYLMRAEANLRKSNVAVALADVNALRSARQHPRLLTQIDLDILYRERGYELYWENLRRTDMIRFGEYEKAWTDKPISDPFRRLLPIPQANLDASEGLLEQNPGY